MLQINQAFWLSQISDHANEDSGLFDPDLFARRVVYNFIKMASESLRERRKLDFITQAFVNARIKERYSKIREILKKDSLERTLEEWDVLENSQDVVDEIKKRARRQELAKERVKEV